MTEGSAVHEPAPIPTGPSRDHATYMGASDGAALVGAHPFSTQLDVWAEKTGRIKFEGNQMTEAGDEFERPIVRMYQRQVGCAIDFTGTLFHPEHAHVGATPDAIRDRSRTVQVKFVGYGQRWRWGNPQDGPDGVPPELIPQVHQESALARLVLGIPAEVAEVVAQIGTERRIYEIPIDHEFGEALLVLADDFWQRHVIPDVMPEVHEADMATLLALHPTVKGAKLKFAPAEVVALARAYDQARGDESRARTAKELLGARIAGHIGDGPGFFSAQEGIVASWPQTKGRADWKAIAGAFGDLAVKHGAPKSVLKPIIDAHTGAPSRSLNIRVKGK